MRSLFCTKKVSRVFQVKLKDVFSSFKGFQGQWYFKAVSKKFKRCFKEVSRVFQESFKRISRKFQGCFNADEGCFKEVFHRIFERSSKGIRVLQGSF